MPVRGPQGRRPPSEPASCHKGRWEDEPGKEGAGRILCAKDPVLKTLLKSETNEEVRCLCTEMLFIPVLVSMRTLFI